MKKFLTSLLLVGSQMVHAQQARNIPQIGVHFPILTVEKNINPQNKLVVYTLLDGNCVFLLDDSNSPTFDFYWLMNGSSYKPVHSMIKAQVRKRLTVGTVDPRHNGKSFSVEMNDLKELNHDIPDPKMTVVAKPQGDQCSVGGFLRLGPSDGNAMIQVDSIYSKAKGMISPKLVSVTIRGRVVSNGQAVVRTYYAP